MPTHRRELLYLSVFATALILVGVAGAQLVRSYWTLPADASQTACQLVMYQSTQSSRVALATLVIGALTVLTLKITASVVLYRQLSVSLLARQRARLPAKLQRICLRHRVDPTVLILVRDAHLIALTIGARRPRLLLSTGLVSHLSARQLEAVILHEQHHARHYHPVVLLLAGLIAKALFFIPLLSDLLRHMRTEFEYQADQAAVRTQQTTRHLREAMALVLQSPTPTLSLVAAFASSNIQERIAFLNSSAQPRFRVPALSACLTALAITGVLLLAKPAAAQVPSATSPGPSCSFLNCVSACMQETMELATSEKTPSSKLGTSSPAIDHSGNF